MNTRAVLQGKRSAADCLGRLQPRQGQGKRTPALMSKDEEAQFFNNWEHRAQACGALRVALFHFAYEEQVGQRVPEATIHRMLKRQARKPPCAHDGP